MELSNCIAMEKQRKTENPIWGLYVPINFFAPYFALADAIAVQIGIDSRGIDQVELKKPRNEQAAKSDFSSDKDAPKSHQSGAKQSEKEHQSSREAATGVGYS
ncbi:MAG: hypothetical protein P4L57_14430 [Rhizomicrobium sp.]|nr:hypothetical protein [Rhizomicrobium sp.]